MKLSISLHTVMVCFKNDLFYSIMELPEDIVQIISEYSKPLTRPDWRTLHIMKPIILHNEFERQMFCRFKKLETVNDVVFIRLIRSYKPIFDENYYNDFKISFNNFIYK